LVILKGKSAIYIARAYLWQKKNYGGMSFWAFGYFVSTVGTDEEVVRTYIREQEKEDKRVQQSSHVNELMRNCIFSIYMGRFKPEIQGGGLLGNYRSFR